MYYIWWLFCFQFFFFFFSSRRRHTRYWRDWNSDVCSSDLETCLLMRFTESGGRRSVVVGIDAATGKRGLAGVAAHVCTALDQKQVRTSSAFAEQNQYGGLPCVRRRGGGMRQQRRWIRAVDSLEQGQQPRRRNGCVAHTVTPR